MTAAHLGREVQHPFDDEFGDVLSRAEGTRGHGAHVTTVPWVGKCRGARSAKSPHAWVVLVAH